MRSTDYNRSTQITTEPPVGPPAATSPKCKQFISFCMLNANSIGNKSTTVSTTIEENACDVFLLTETWHTTNEDTALRRCVPPGYVCLDVPRPSKDIARTNLGGFAAIITDKLSYKIINPPVQPTTFESICFSFTGSTATVIVLLLYRSGFADVTNKFFTELTAYLEVVALYKCQVVIADIHANIHVERSTDSDTIKLNEILDCFDCIQHTPLAPTDRRGGTLDLVITKSDESIEDVIVDLPQVISDHSLLRWRLPLVFQPPIISTREVRSWGKLDKEKFRHAVLNFELCDLARRPTEADKFFEIYHSTLRSIADQFAPVRMITIIIISSSAASTIQ